MNRFVYNIFKTIMFFMIFVFVWDMGFYLYRAVSLNSRIENYMVPMQKVIMENNYIPEDNFTEFQAILESLRNQYNQSDIFIRSIKLNYKQDAVNLDRVLPDGAHIFSSSGTNLLVLDTSKPAKYGYIMCLQLRVEIQQPQWGWTSSNSRSGVEWTNDPSRITQSVTGNQNTTVMTYNYFVPCQHYNTINP